MPGQMLFEDRRGTPIGVLEHRQDGSARVADGLRIFTLEQAAAHFPSWSQEDLTSLWRDTLADAGAELTRQAEKMEAAGHVDAAALEQGGGLSPAKLDLLHATIVPHLERRELEAFVEICRQKDVNPWLNRVIPKVERDHEGKRRIVLVTTVEQLLIIAEHTGRYDGATKPRFTDPHGNWSELWTSSDPPFAAEVGVRKKGFSQVEWGAVLWSELAQHDAQGQLEQRWADMPALMLAKCAKAAALRAAFPEECGGFYVAEELRRRRPPAQEEIRPLGERLKSDCNLAQDSDIDDSLPTTEQSFRLAMIEMLGSRRAPAVIEGLKREFGTRMQPVQFYAAAVRAVRDNPQLYGVEAASVA